jgi:hypothetical protein
MLNPGKRATRALAIVASAGALAVVASSSIGGAAAPAFSGVPNAQTKQVGIAQPNVITPELALIERVRGSNKLENGTADIPYYGYDGDGPMVPAPGAVQSPGHNVEATKSEPDKNTYLVLQGQTGADPNYNYGTHFIFQAHELGKGYITRVNLDADDAHRVTLMATQDSSGTPLAPTDGSTWDPWAQRLILTTESSGAGTGAYQATLGVPSTVDSLIGSFGAGGYEAAQNDSNGNVWLVEDIGGTTVPTASRNPNSFIYRFVPHSRSDLTKGKLQVLQLTSLRTGNPITFQAVDAAHPTGAVFTDDTADMHTYGHTFKAKFVTIHDTAVDGTTSFLANALAKTKGGTPFKRPENGVFRPNTAFTQFFFDETGDTNATATANNGFGGFGGIDRLTLDSPGADTGKLSVFYVGDIDHDSFDNTNFWDKNQIVFVEDRGDTLHAQHNALDSAWVFDTRTDYSKPANQPVRMIAQGRDTSATLDSAYSAAGNGFQNEGDNEITGFHVSNGDPTVNGILGAANPNPFHYGWRAFVNNQHGDNIMDEIVANPANGN